MEEPNPQEDLAARVSTYVALFAAMLSATIAGQLIGIAVDAGLRTRSPWPPAICCIVLEGAAGGWVAASRRGHSLSASECARLSIGYSLALVAWTAPLAVWTAAAQRASEHGSADLPIASALARMTPGTFGLACLIAVAWTALRSPVVRAASAWRASRVPR